jgi:hypothetical protein
MTNPAQLSALNSVKKWQHQGATSCATECAQGENNAQHSAQVASKKKRIKFNVAVMAQISLERRHTTWPSRLSVCKAQILMVLKKM